MKKTIGAVCALLGAVMLVGCGGNNNHSISAVEACRSAYSTICTRAFQCPGFSPTYLNSDDCRTDLYTSCTEAQVNCGAGQVYHPDMAESCVDQFGQFNCAQIEGWFGGVQSSPSACQQWCSAS